VLDETELTYCTAPSSALREADALADAAVDNGNRLA
jgi:hypothetical protein